MTAFQQAVRTRLARGCTSASGPFRGNTANLLAENQLLCDSLRPETGTKEKVERTLSAVSMRGLRFGFPCGVGRGAVRRNKTEDSESGDVTMTRLALLPRMTAITVVICSATIWPTDAATADRFAADQEWRYSVIVRNVA